LKSILRERLKLGLKLLLGAVLIYYVLRSKMVDFYQLKLVLFSPLNLVISLLFLAFATLCCATRWYLLVRAQDLSLTRKELFELTMIGNFFNTFMPGSVGGDLIKAWYVAGQEPKRKTKAIFTVLLDRMVGLSVIVFYAASTLLFYTEWLEQRRELQVLAYSVWGFTGASLLLTFLFFFNRNGKAVIRVPKILRRVEAIAKVIDAGLLYRNHLTAVIFAVLLSALSVFGTNLLYQIQGTTLGISLPFSQYLFIVPVALTVSAIPILPGGIGVGQVAFFTLFQWMNIPNPERGGTLCTLMQIYTILFNCIGAFFYLRFKRRPQETGEIPPALVKRAAM